jgi:citrate synthase
MIEAVEKTGNAESYVKSILDKGERLMGFGHRVIELRIHALAHCVELQKS